MLQVDWQAVSREYLMESAAGGDSTAARILRGLLLEERQGGAQAAALAEGKAIRVVIGVCTANRPCMLRHCIESLGQQIIPAGVELHLVVVDNETAPNNRHLVKRLAAKCPFSVHYIHQAARGIPMARNTVLDMCRALEADWIAFTDDDCWVSPDWLASHLDAACRDQADVVYGRRELVLPATSWAVPAERPRFIEGQRLRSAATHNVLFAGWLIAEGRGGCLRFDEDLAHGEDTDFFYRATLRGARITYSHAPVVFEAVSAERATLGRQSSRAYYTAASRSYFHRRHGSTLRALVGVLDRLVLKLPAALARLSAAPVVGVFSRQASRSLILKGIARLAGVAGAVAGLLGRPGNPYKVVD